MIALLLVSNVLIWIALFLTIRIVIVVMKTKEVSVQQSNQTDLLEESHGYDVNELFPEIEVKTLSGQSLTIVGSQKNSILLYSLAGCKPCKGMYKFVNDYVEKNKDVQVILFIVGTDYEIEDIVDQYQLEVPIVPISPDDYDDQRTKIFPFGYFVSKEGFVVKKGVISREKEMDILLSYENIVS